MIVCISDSPGTLLMCKYQIRHWHRHKHAVTIIQRHVEGHTGYGYG